MATVEAGQFCAPPPKYRNATKASRPAPVALHSCRRPRVHYVTLVLMSAGAAMDASGCVVDKLAKLALDGDLFAVKRLALSHDLRLDVEGLRNVDD